jgi:hypothetical protein
VGNCDFDGHCYEKTPGRFTVNGVESGSGQDVIGGGGVLKATVQFFGQSGPDPVSGEPQNNMDPIRDVLVIYDVTSRRTTSNGGHTGSHPGLYKNHRGYYDPTGAGDRSSICGSTQAKYEHFGTTGAACDDSGPFTFVIDYTCSKNPASRCMDGTNDCWVQAYLPPGADSTTTPARGACVYNPGVHILNNWGICTGFCIVDGGLAGTLCSDGAKGRLGNSAVYKDPIGVDDQTIDECSITAYSGIFNRPYISFGVSGSTAGRIVVYPED